MGPSSMLLTSDGQGLRYGREYLLNGYLVPGASNFFINDTWDTWSQIKYQGVNKVTMYEYLKKLRCYVELEKGKESAILRDRYPIGWYDYLDCINTCLDFVDSLAPNIIIVSRSDWDDAFYETEYIQFWKPEVKHGFRRNAAYK